MGSNNRDLRRDRKLIGSDFYDIDYGYKYFWRKRGVSPPPPVSSCWMDVDLPRHQDEAYSIYMEDISGLIGE